MGLSHLLVVDGGRRVDLNMALPTRDKSEEDAYILPVLPIGELLKNS